MECYVIKPLRPKPEGLNIDNELLSSINPISDMHSIVLERPSDNGTESHSQNVQSNLFKQTNQDVSVGMLQLLQNI